MSLHIVVCVKLVPDPEAPPTSVEVDEENMQVFTRGVSPVINSFDESALEAAIRIKEAAGGKITLLSAGKSLSQAVILKALAAGADEAVLVEDNEIETDSLNSWSTAAILAHAIKQHIEDFDLVLCGRQAADTNAGQVGLGLSTFLEVPAVTLAQRVEKKEGDIEVERVLADGYEIVIASSPVLVTVSGELGELRFPSIQAIKAAKKLPQKKLSLQDLAIEQVPPKVQTFKLATPSRERECKFIEEDAPEDAGRKLARLVPLE